MTIRKIQALHRGEIEIDTHTSNDHAMLTVATLHDETHIYMTHDQLLALIGLATVSEAELTAATAASTKEKKR